MLNAANSRKHRRVWPLMLIGISCLALCSRWVSAGEDLSGIRLFANLGGWAHALAVSPDWKFFATESINGDVRIYDADTGFELRRMMGQPHIGCEAAYSPDGKLLLTTSGDKSLTVWNAADGKELLKVLLKGGTSAEGQNGEGQNGDKGQNGDSRGTKRGGTKRGQPPISLLCKETNGDKGNKRGQPPISLLCSIL